MTHKFLLRLEDRLWEDIQQSAKVNNHSLHEEVLNRVKAGRYRSEQAVLDLLDIDSEIDWHPSGTNYKNVPLEPWTGTGEQTLRLVEWAIRCARQRLYTTRTRRYKSYPKHQG